MVGSNPRLSAPSSTPSIQRRGYMVGMAPGKQAGTPSGSASRVMPSSDRGRLIAHPTQRSPSSRFGHSGKVLPWVVCRALTLTAMENCRGPRRQVLFHFRVVVGQDAGNVAVRFRFVAEQVAGCHEI